MIVRFVDIGGIDDYHRLNFLFINWFIIWLPLLKFLNLLLNVVYFFVSITCPNPLVWVIWSYKNYTYLLKGPS
jgi:hypothetical protein